MEWIIATIIYLVVGFVLVAVLECIAKKPTPWTAKNTWVVGCVVLLWPLVVVVIPYFIGRLAGRLVGATFEGEGKQ